MTATDELRAELTKRGVEWKAPSSYDGSNRYDTVAGGYWFHEFDGKITIHGLTPTQAITATLGSGTCHDVGDPSDFCCSECGTRMFTNTDDTYTMIDSLGNIIEQPSFCPNCGRKVMDE